jgi:hypothetical protein
MMDTVLFVVLEYVVAWDELLIVDGGILGRLVLLANGDEVVMTVRGGIEVVTGDGGKRLIGDGGEREKAADRLKSTTGNSKLESKSYQYFDGSNSALESLI